MKTIALLNITLIVLTAVLVADIMLTIYHPAETDYTRFTRLISPITIWLSLFLIRTIYLNRQKTLDQLSSVKINKGWRKILDL